jgi:hypothetical protein
MIRRVSRIPICGGMSTMYAWEKAGIASRRSENASLTVSVV